MKIFIALLCGFFLFCSCKKDNDNVLAEDMGRMMVSIKMVAGLESLILHDGIYENSSGEDFNVDILRFYLSNFSFQSIDGRSFIVPQDSAYFLIDAEETTSMALPFSLPLAEYSSLSFLIGVDSLRSTMDISKRVGVLDPTTMAGDMYWGWNSGYIFLKIEGEAPVSPEAGRYLYHIGGFGGYAAPTINNIRKVTLDLKSNGNAIVKNDKISEVVLQADILKIFEGNTRVSIQEHPAEMFTLFSSNIADNYACCMFSHSETINQ